VQSKGGEVKEAVKTAIACGYRLLDTAYAYGNEKEIGETLAEILSEGSVCREDLFIISKVHDLNVFFLEGLVLFESLGWKNSLEHWCKFYVMMIIISKYYNPASFFQIWPCSSKLSKDLNLKHIFLALMFQWL